MCIKDKTTKEERKARGIPKDTKWRSLTKSLQYKDEGELYLKNLNQNCLAKIINSDNFEVEIEATTTLQNGTV